MRCGMLGQMSNQVAPNALDSNLKPPTQLGTGKLVDTDIMIQTIYRHAEKTCNREECLIQSL